jgi:glucose-6-phosphate isomerase
VISIGIGGSYLGPEFVYEALRTDPEAGVAAQGRRLRFLANVDPVDVARALEGVDPKSTLVVVVSKTFTTAETMLNARTLKQWLLDNVPGDPNHVIASHMVAVR